MSETERIVDRAMAGTDLDGDGCLVSNRSAHRLYEFNSDALGAIEAAITSRVVPISTRCSDPSELRRQFRGLENVFGVYLRIGFVCSTDRAVEFVRGLTGPVRVVMLNAVASYFRTDNATQRVSPVPLPSPMISYLREIATSSENAESTAAAFAIRMCLPEV
jgi:hypothetical protein